MATERTVVVVGKSEELDLALDALTDLELTVRVIPTVAEAERALLGAHPPLVGAVLIGLEHAPLRGLDLIRSLRTRSALGVTPIAVWAPASSAHLLADAYREGASSGVLLGAASESAIRLAQMIHYWAVANEAPIHEALA